LTDNIILMSNWPTSGSVYVVSTPTYLVHQQHEDETSHQGDTDDRVLVNQAMFVLVCMVVMVASVLVGWGWVFMFLC